MGFCAGSVKTAIVRSMSKSPVSLTFDDGREEQYTKFYPILDEYDLKATFYVVTQRINWKGVMSWDELKTLYKEGNEIGSHTHTHPHLTTLSNDELDFEFKKSHNMLRIFNCSSLAYPYGEHDERVIEHAKKYFAAARSHYNPNFGNKGLGLNLNPSHESHKLKVFPTEQTIPLKGFEGLENCSLFGLPLHMFKRTFMRLLEYNIKRKAWIIFTIHGTYDGKNISWVFKKPKEMTKYFASRLVRMSTIIDFAQEKALRKDKILKFKWMCEILAQNDQLEVFPVSRVIQKSTVLNSH